MIRKVILQTVKSSRGELSRVVSRADLPWRNCQVVTWKGVVTVRIFSCIACVSVSEQCELVEALK